MSHFLKKPNNQSGFLLIELILVLLLVAIITVVAIPLSRYFYLKNDLGVAANIFSQTLKRSQVLAMSVDGDIDWGVYIQGGSIVLFKGDSYASRYTDFDEVFSISSNIVISGNSEIVFSKFLGTPETTGTTTLAIDNGGSINVTINEFGVVDY